MKQRAGRGSTTPAGQKNILANILIEQELLIKIIKISYPTT